MISVTDGSSTQTVFTVPLGKIASIVEVKENDPALPTPKVAVEGLEEMITQEDKDNAALGTEDVEVKLEVENVGGNADGAGELGKLRKIDTFLDIGLFKTTTKLDAQGHANSVKTNNIGSVNRVVLEIAIPYPGLPGRAARMFSYHDGAAEILTALTARPKENFRDGTFFVDYAGGYIFLYASRFSTYAISVDDDDTESASTPAPAPNPTLSGGGGSSGGGSGPRSYRIAVADAEHGSVTVSAKTATNGQRVTLTPESGYLTDSVTVKASADKNVAVTKSGTNVFRFTMPTNDVTVSAAFVKEDADSGDAGTNAAPDNGDSTVAAPNSGDSKTDSKETPKPLSPDETGVSDWLITDEHPTYIQGFSDGTFHPNANITRAQAAMMFYRLLKNQNVTRTESFNDMNGDEWYAEVVYALSSLGIIQGYSDGSFRGNNSITRAAFTAIATRFAKSNATVPYDSDAWYYYNVAEAAHEHGFVVADGKETWNR